MKMIRFLCGPLTNEYAQTKHSGVLTMTDPINNETIEDNNVDFANLLESFESTSNVDIRVGDKISGEILSIGMDTVFVSTGTKIDGAVEKNELLDENQDLPYKKGDTIELYVISASEHEIKLSKALSGAGSANQLYDAYHSSMPVEGKVREQCKGGFYVEMLQKKVFCPISQMDTQFIQTPEDYIGNTYQFVIIKYEEGGRNIIVSRRQLLAQEQEAMQADYFEKYPPDSIVEGTVTRLMNYGAFVELFPGLEGMVHISEISWSRVEDIKTVLNEGDKVRVKILSISDGKKKGQYKIALSMKQVDGDPWNQELPVKVGDRFKGTVKKCMNFGAFVEIASGIEGLVHISEMSYIKRILKPEDVVKIGDQVDVVIKSIDVENKKIALSMKDAEGDPWIGIGDKFRVGQIIDGKIERKEKFGLFVSLVPGITGLMPISVIKKHSQPARIERLDVGDSIKAEIKEINIDERKISLGPGDEDNEKGWENFSKVKDSGNSDFSDQLKKLKLNFS
jgi:small subunit ribosomal protein S1